MEVDSATGKPVMKEKIMIKIIVLGCANVGKTSIMERYNALF
jgi:GTPase SAR1 family protein